MIQLRFDDASIALAHAAVFLFIGVCLDYDYRPSDLLALRTDPGIVAKLDKCYSVIRDQFTLINPLRPGKKLLVLDLDYTLFDMRSEPHPESGWNILRRPFTHRFLTAAYQHYEIVIWSQTSWRWLELKLTELGILTHTDYKVLFVLDKTSMFRIESVQSGGDKRKHHVKPLELIWRKFPHWSASNTIHIDDLGRNFALNPQSGLKIKPYKDAHTTRPHDRELVYLTRYLQLIANEKEFTGLDHANWKKVVEAMADTQ